MLFDPLNNTKRVHDIFEAARKEIPNKPVKYVINTHHHFDHLGGLRYDISEGAIIITQAQTQGGSTKNRRPCRIPSSPTRLAESPKKAVFETVGDSQGADRRTRRLEIYRIWGFSHVDTMLMAYLPKEKS